MQTVMLRERPWFGGLAVERETATKQRGFIPRWPFCEAKEQDAVCRQKAESCFTEALRADKEMENGVIHKEMSETDQSKLVQGSPSFLHRGSSSPQVMMDGVNVSPLGQVIKVTVYLK